MKKETVVAIVLGVLTGVVIAVLLIVNSQNKKLDDRRVISPQVSPTIKLVQQNIATIKIISPQNYSTSEKETINIKGNAPKDSLIIIHSPTSEKIEKATKDEFSIDFPLSIGENKIKITVYQKKDMQQKELKIYYLANE